MLGFTPFASGKDLMVSGNDMLPAATWRHFYNVHGIKQQDGFKSSYCQELS